MNNRFLFIPAIEILLFLFFLAAGALAQEMESLCFESGNLPWEGSLWEKGKETEYDFKLTDLDGFRIDHEDYRIKIGGRFVLDAIKYGRGNKRDSGLEWDEIFLRLEAESGPFKALIEPDILGVDTQHNLYEAWGSWEYSPAFRLTGGQMRVALGSEYATRAEDFPLVGYGYTSYLSGRHGAGLRLDGDLLWGGLWYEATATTGGHDFDLEGHRQENAQYSLRMVGFPFWGMDPTYSKLARWCRGLFFGLAYTYSREIDGPIILNTPYESRVFNSRDLDGDGTRWLMLETGFKRGSFRLGWEGLKGKISDVPIVDGVVEDIRDNKAWNVYASYILSGEAPEWDRGRWLPIQGQTKEKYQDHGILSGRWEIGMRLSKGNLDRKFMRYGYANEKFSSRRAGSFSLDLNWIPLKRTRFVLGWVRTVVDHSLPVFGDDRRDSSFVLRMDITF